MTTGMQFRRIAPTYTATKWTKLGDHPEVIQPDPLGGGILATPRGLEQVNIGDWVVEGGPEVKHVIPALVFEQLFEATGTHRQAFREWKETREVHPNEIGVDNGEIGEAHRHHFGGRKHVDETAPDADASAAAELAMVQIRDRTRRLG